MLSCTHRLAITKSINSHTGNYVKKTKQEKKDEENTSTFNGANVNSFYRV